MGPVTPREYLASLELHGVKLGLDNIAALLESAGNPHRSYPTVHVAGTNGKGSVVAMLHAMFHGAGYHTGCFTSPHLIEVNERFLMDTRPIPDGELDDAIEFFRAASATFSNPPTYFELATAVAFRWFALQQVELALIEVGMGGRLDCTNVITPLACAVTNIDLEHTAYLGTTLEAIAFEKAGILKRGVPAVIAETKPGPRDVILRRAGELGCPVHLLGQDFTYTVEGDPFAQRFTYESAGLSFGPVRLALAGEYQGENAATAVALAELLIDSYPRLSQEAVVRGLGSVRWPCRFEKVTDQPAIIIDVAHNAAGARKLATGLPECVVVLAVSSDKHIAQMVQALAPVTRHLVLSQFSGSRALPVDRLCAGVGSHPYHRTETISEAVSLGLRLAAPSLPLVITGSIFTAGEARKLLIDDYGAARLRY